MNWYSDGLLYISVSSIYFSYYKYLPYFIDNILIRFQALKRYEEPTKANNETYCKCHMQHNKCTVY